MPELLSPKENAALWDVFMDEHFPVSVWESRANAEDLATLLAAGKERLFAPSETNDTYAKKYRQYTKGLEPGEEFMKTNNLWNLFRLDVQESLKRLFIDARPDPSGAYRSYGESDGRVFEDEVRQSLWAPQLYYLQKSGLLQKVFEKLGMKASEDFMKLQLAVEQGFSIGVEAASKGEMEKVLEKHEIFLEKIFVILAEMGIVMSSVDG